MYQCKSSSNEDQIDLDDDTTILKVTYLKTVSKLDQTVPSSKLPDPFDPFVLCFSELFSCITSLHLLTIVQNISLYCRDKAVMG